MNSLQTPSDDTSGVSLETVGDATLMVRLSGGWHLQKNAASASPVQKALATEQIHHVRFDAKALSSWDSSILIFLTKVTELCRQNNIDSDREGLPKGIRRLLELAEIVPEQEGARQATDQPAFLARVGSTAADFYLSLSEMLRFLGEVTLAFVQLLKGRATFRKADLFLIIQECGPQALPIVTLISFLVGLILAFVGAVQLQQFGAQIYVANLVGIAMVREMGAMMTGIIMAGRTGAAFAAQLGTMKVTQEIDALRPRWDFADGVSGAAAHDRACPDDAAAVSLRRPDGILGGAAWARDARHLAGRLTTTRPSMRSTSADCSAASSRAQSYGVLIALSGCLRGMQCGSSCLGRGRGRNLRRGHRASCSSSPLRHLCRGILHVIGI